MIWIKYSEQKPTHGVEVIAYNESWINEDLNPRGIRVGFRTDAEEFVSAAFLKYESLEYESVFGDPTYWCEIPELQ